MAAPKPDKEAIAATQPVPVRTTVERRAYGKLRACPGYCFVAMCDGVAEKAAYARNPMLFRGLRFSVQAA